MVLADNVWQMHDHRGPNFARWRAGMVRSVGGRLLDEPLTDPQTASGD